MTSNSLCREKTITDLPDFALLYYLAHKNKEISEEPAPYFRYLQSGHYLPGKCIQVEWNTCFPIAELDHILPGHTPSKFPPSPGSDSFGSTWIIPCRPSSTSALSYSTKYFTFTSSLWQGQYSCNHWVLGSFFCPAQNLL